MSMEKENFAPGRLYKYRAFSSLTLDQLVCDHVFFADPSSFNDPLDTRPSLETDLRIDELEEILRHFVERRTSAEMSAAARTINYLGPKTKDHIRRQSRNLANQIIADIAYNATNPEYENEDDARTFYLRHAIEVELPLQYGKGIVSLAEQATCPLMWSHYGDQHRGICIGYSVPKDTQSQVQKVMYNGGRLVKASSVAAMIAGDDAARAQVDEAVLLRKADNWNYEQEWRLIGEYGLQNSPLELEEVIFGIRCKSSVKFSVAKALEDRGRQVRLYEIREVPGTFELEKCPLTGTHEMLVQFPRRARSVFEDFSPVRVVPSPTEES